MHSQQKSLSVDNAFERYAVVKENPIKRY